ncbi:hypothetical protein Mapa_015069 [Marchantia paleacea]|nr:hypothetical protein Mapa_015069 [Marchantia paleacea]
MSASRVSTSQPMSEVRINYNAPLKSVRTQRVVKPHEPPKLSFDGSVGSEDGRTSPREEDVKRPGISFMWENAPGKSKIEEREESILPAELKLPPLSLTPTKAKDVSPFYPPPAGTPAHKLNPFASLPPKLSPSPSRATPLTTAATDRTPPRSRPIPAPPARRSFDSHSPAQIRPQQQQHQRQQRRPAHQSPRPRTRQEWSHPDPHRHHRLRGCRHSRPAQISRPEN